MENSQIETSRHAAAIERREDEGGASKVNGSLAGGLVPTNGSLENKRTISCR
jgi:hypothetical protein